MVCKNSVACLLPIRCDDDIVYDHLLYYYNLGVRNFFITVHCGNGEDEKEIERFKKDSGSHIKVIIDNNPAYRQRVQYLHMSEQAKKFRWHIMSDTDELLVLKKYETLDQLLDKYKNHDGLLFDWFDYMKAFDKKCFRWMHRQISPKAWTKAIMKYRKGLEWSYGHHHIEGKGSFSKVDGAFFAHFPWRSFERWKQRRLDFADAKYKSFGNSEAWMQQCNYHEIKKNPMFLEKRWEVRHHNYRCDMKFDPIKHDLFLLKNNS